MSERPAYGTSPIRCSKYRCKWRGYEGELVRIPHKSIPSMTSLVCPTCECNSYYFMTPKEIAAWEKTK